MEKIKFSTLRYYTFHSTETTWFQEAGIESRRKSELLTSDWLFYWQRAKVQDSRKTSQKFWTNEMTCRCSQTAEGDKLEYFGHDLSGKKSSKRLQKLKKIGWMFDRMLNRIECFVIDWIETGEKTYVFFKEWKQETRKK